MMSVSQRRAAQLATENGLVSAIAGSFPTAFVICDFVFLFVPPCN